MYQKWNRTLASHYAGPHTMHKTEEQDHLQLFMASSESV
jgi:hypothetical protein